MAFSTLEIAVLLLFLCLLYQIVFDRLAGCVLFGDDTAHSSSKSAHASESWLFKYGFVSSRSAVMAAPHHQKVQAHLVVSQLLLISLLHIYV